MADRTAEKMHGWVLAIARAMFINRLHVLRLTEVVRHGIRPNEDGVMLLPEALDDEMRKQAFDFVLTMMPEEFRVDLLQARQSWLTVQ